MTRKQPWMKLGASVMANGRAGVITAREMKTIDNVVHVHWFKVKHQGDRFSTRYFPDKVEQLEPEVSNA